MIAVSYFCVRHKKKMETQSTFQTAIFQNKLTLWHIRLYLHIENYIYLV